MHDLAVMLQTSGCDCRLQFGEIEARAGNGDARTYIDAFGNFGTEVLSYQMAPRIERDDALRVAPLWKRPDVCRRMGVGEIRASDRVEGA